MVRCLLSHKANPNNTDIDHKSTLRYAVETGNANIVCLLIEHNAVDVVPHSGPLTSMQYSCREGQWEIVMYMLQNGCGDPTYCKGMDRSVLEHAVRRGHLDLAQNIISVIRKERGDNVNNTLSLADCANVSRMDWEPQQWAISNGTTHKNVLRADLTQPGLVEADSTRGDRGQQGRLCVSKSRPAYYNRSQPSSCSSTLFQCHKSKLHHASDPCKAKLQESGKGCRIIDSGLMANVFQDDKCLVDGQYCDETNTSPQAIDKCYRPSPSCDLQVTDCRRFRKHGMDNDSSSLPFKPVTRHTCNTLPNYIIYLPIAIS